MCELEQLEQLLSEVKRLVASKKKFVQLSNKRREMDPQNSTFKAIGRVNADLNWHAMEHDKLVHDVHALCVDCELAEPRKDYGRIDYHPDSFHHYQYQPRIPLCRQEKK